MISTLLLTLVLADFPPLEIDTHPPLTEEELFLDIEEEIKREVFPHPFSDEAIIAEQENRKELLAFVQEVSAFSYDASITYIDPKIQEIFDCYIEPGTTVLDFGAKRGASTLACASLAGKVIAIEKNREQFRQLFWNVAHHKIKNTQLYCSYFEGGLDSLELDKVSLILIDGNGQEDIILRGLRKIIHKWKPTLLITIAGGLPFEYADRYVRQEYQMRLDKIKELGYSTQLITSGKYLAIPNE